MTNIMQDVNLQRFKLTIEYDGTDFCGWQFQPDLRTVQGELESALEKLYQRRTPVAGSGRTDAGVHAQAQIAHFDVPRNKYQPEKIRNAINGMTGCDVYVHKIEEVPDSFHARFSAVNRTYRYCLLRKPEPLKLRYAHCPNYSWNNDIIIDALNLIDGAHSFKSFCRQRPDEMHYECTVLNTEWIEDACFSIFYITANRFFHQMVRGLTGALLDLGRGYYKLNDLRKLIERPQKNAAVHFVPPNGLTLIEVSYD